MKQEYAPGIPDKKAKTLIPSADNAQWEANIQIHDAKRAGCFTPGSRVKMSDGSLKRISEINEGDLVKSYNISTGKVEAKKVLNIWINGSTDEWNKFYLNNKNGCMSTPDHNVYVSENGKINKRAAKDIVAGDFVLKEDKAVSESQKSFLIGALLGDGSIPQDYTGSPTFCWGQAKKIDLVNFFASKFESWVETRKPEGNRSEFFSFRKKHEYFHELSDLFYSNKVKVIKDSLLDLITPEVIAQWYMDDGQWGKSKSQFNTLTRNKNRRKDAVRDKNSGTVYLYTNGFTKGDCEKLKNYINETFNLSFVLRSREVEISTGKAKYYYLSSYSIESNRNFFNLIKKYIHPEFSYKLPDNDIKDRPEFTGFLNYNTVYSVPVIKGSNPHKTKQGKNKNQKLSIKKYDLEIEDNHNYFVSGILVSNSHYDLRLNPKGSDKALSWAIRNFPKPGEKTLAIRQPDHTKEYMGFSGEIPEGYGAGKVNSVFKDKIDILKARPGVIEFNMYPGNRTERYFMLNKPNTDDWLLYNYTPTKNTKAYKDVPNYKPKYKSISPEKLKFNGEGET